MIHYPAKANPHSQKVGQPLAVSGRQRCSFESGFRGSECSSWYLQGRHFTSWDISLAQDCYFLWSLFLNSWKYFEVSHVRMTFVNILKSTALLLRVSFVLCELSPNTSPISCPWTTLVPCLFLRKTLLINPNQKLGGLFPINSLRIFEVWKPWAVHEYHDAFTKSRVVPNSPSFATHLWHPHPRGNHFYDCSHYRSVWYLLQCHGNSIMHPESWYDTVSEVHSCYHTHP